MTDLVEIGQIQPKTQTETRKPRRKAELAVVRQQSVAPSPFPALDRILAAGVTGEDLTKLMDVQERWEKNQARKAFDAALAAAKAEMPVLHKNRRVYFKTTKGTTDYRFEDLAEIQRKVGPVLAKHGLSYRWRVSSAINEPVSVTCVLAHEAGHFEETTLTSGRDDDQSNKNSIQRIGSTISYLERYTLKAAVGLASSEDDDDGNGSELGPDDGNGGDPEPTPPTRSGPPGAILAHQVNELRDMIAQRCAPDQSLEAWEKGFCTRLKIARLEVLPFDRFANAVALLKTKPVINQNAKAAAQ